MNINEFQKKVKGFTYNADIKQKDSHDVGILFLSDPDKTIL